MWSGGCPRNPGTPILITSGAHHSIWSFTRTHPFWAGGQQQTTPPSGGAGAQRSHSNISMYWSSKQHILQSRHIGNHHRLISTCASTTPQRWHISTRGGGGGHTLTVSVSDSTGTLVSCPQDQILGDSNTYSRNPQCRCRHGISSIQPQGGMDIGFPDISEDSGSVLSPGGRSVCIKANPPGRELCLQISISGGNSSRRISPRLEQVEEFYTSSCEPSSSSSEEDPGRGSISPGNSTELAQCALVPTVSTDVGGLPPAASNIEVSTIPPIRPPGPPSSVGNPQPGGMASIRRRFETAGFSPDVIEILLSSWSESTKKRYAGPWKAWAEWCTMRGWCPSSAPVTAVLSFLASLLKEKDLEYRTIAVYRSAISQTHDPIDSVPLGELPIVSKFMKGVFRAKPPKPKYCSSWNVAKVLDFLRNQEPLDKIPLKMLTFKLTT